MEMEVNMSTHMAPNLCDADTYPCIVFGTCKAETRGPVDPWTSTNLLLGTNILACRIMAFITSR